jgi:hypothetical protein
MLRALIARANHRGFHVLLKVVSKPISCKRALRFRASREGIRTDLHRVTQCPPEEVLAGFGRHHRRSAEDG